jgi:predicted phage-related endonuclease
MACSEANVVHIPTMLFGRFRVYQIERHEVLICRIIDMVSAFWTRVVTRDPPEPDWAHPSTSALLRALYPITDAKSVQLGHDAQRAIVEYESAHAAIREAGAAKDAAKARCLHLLGDAAVGYLPDGRRLVRSQIKVREHTVAEYSYVRFDVRKK